MSRGISDSRGLKHPGSIAVVNYKGGVGKSTVTYLLGLYISLKTGRKVLLLDIDAQCSLTFAVGLEPEDVSLSRHNLYHLVKPEAWITLKHVKIQDYVKAVPKLPAPLYIVPGAFEVENLDIEITEAVHSDRERGKTEFFLYCRQLISSFSEYSYILIDTPPNRMYLTQAMLRASQFYIPVTIPDGISVYGMPRLRQWVSRIEGHERPYMLGYVLNSINRSGGGAEGKTISQRMAIGVLNEALVPLITRYESLKMGEVVCLGEIPRLDPIAKFMGADKEVRLDFVRHTSGQPTVDQCMNALADRAIERIKRYNA